MATDHEVDWEALAAAGRVMVDTATSLKALVPYVQAGNTMARRALTEIRDEIDRLLQDTAPADGGEEG